MKRKWKWRKRELGNTIQKKTLCCVYVCRKQGLTKIKKERERVRKERKEEGKKGEGSHEHEHKQTTAFSTYFM